MPKHPVPKKKTTKRVTKQRYGSFKTKVLNKLTNRTNLTECKDCGSKIPTHTACPDCGKYNGRQVINVQKKVDKITKIKA